MTKLTKQPTLPKLTQDQLAYISNEIAAGAREGTIGKTLWIDRQIWKALKADPLSGLQTAIEDGIDLGKTQHIKTVQSLAQEGDWRAIEWLGKHVHGFKDNAPDPQHSEPRIQIILNEPLSREEYNIRYGVTING